MNVSTDKEIINNLIQKLFKHVDKQEWSSLEKGFFLHTINIDIVGLSKNDRIHGEYIAIDFCKIWKNFLKNTDARYRSVGEMIVKVENENATVFTDVTITHFKKNLIKGTTREYIGYYNFDLEKINNEWLISKFIYQLAHKSGNIDLE